VKPRIVKAGLVWMCCGAVGTAMNCLYGKTPKDAYDAWARFSIQRRPSRAGLIAWPTVIDPRFM
jgi:hypothetical protein